MRPHIFLSSFSNGTGYGREVWYSIADGGLAFGYTLIGTASDIITYSLSSLWNHGLSVHFHLVTRLRKCEVSTPCPLY
jgi:hypothetical protein